MRHNMLTSNDGHLPQSVLKNTPMRNDVSQLFVQSALERIRRLRLNHTTVWDPALAGRRLLRNL